MPHRRPFTDPATNTVILHDVAAGRWLRFTAPQAVLSAGTPGEVPAVLQAVDRAVAAGAWAAGFLSYEAAPAFDPAFRTHPPTALPLAWFGVYNAPQEMALLCGEEQPEILAWTPDRSYTNYTAAIARIKAYIAAGDTYQVNYTQRLQTAFTGDPWAFFLALTRAQCAAYGAYLDLGAHVLCSASPELFFRLDGTTVTCRPMKGTVRRGCTTAEDAAAAHWLHTSAKNRAENVMIVDMIRNDLGRVARPGSVHVARLFDIERYRTVLQMTSTVTAETTADLPTLFAALFPCASITGAPKVRTMEVINELESTPRGIYTGCIGYIAPGRQAQFNVAIRTVHIDRQAGRAEYGVGGGIVWDSDAREEYDECRAKALLLTARRPTFRLLETLRWTTEEGYFLLDGHLHRLRDSAHYFDYAVDLPRVQAALDAAVEGITTAQRVRLLVSEDGTFGAQAMPLPPADGRCWRVAIARRPVDPTDCLLYHKTTHRAIYEQAKADFPSHDEVILWNTRGEVTEGTFTNLAVRIDGAWRTPPLASGLLPGVYRAHLLATGRLHEAVVTRDDLAHAEEIALFNSVRTWVPAVLDETAR